MIFAESLSCWPLFRVSEALSLPARSTNVSLPCSVCFSKPTFSLFDTTMLRTAWLLDEVAFASVLSVFLLAFPACRFCQQIRSNQTGKGVNALFLTYLKLLHFCLLWFVLDECVQTVCGRYDKMQKREVPPSCMQANFVKDCTFTWNYQNWVWLLQRDMNLKKPIDHCRACSRYMTQPCYLRPSLWIFPAQTKIESADTDRSALWFPCFITLLTLSGRRQTNEQENMRLANATCTKAINFDAYELCPFFPLEKIVMWPDTCIYFRQLYPCCK